MHLISSDTNVWLDFSWIQHLDLPFRLPVTFLMNPDTFEEELIDPACLPDELMHNGLILTELHDEEFLLAIKYAQSYPNLSVHDRMALAIASDRCIPLLTGDMHLRKAAASEGVTVIGTIGICDLLYSENLVTSSEYEECIRCLISLNGGKIRLPEKELARRLQIPGSLFLSELFEE